MAVSTLLSICVGAPISEAPASFPTTPGIHSVSFTTDAGFVLRYAVEIPSTFEAGDPAPLVLALHYGFDRSAPFQPYYGRGFLEGVVSPGLRDLGAVIIAPDSHGKAWSDPEVSLAVLALLNAWKHHDAIDATRKMVTGFSMGGHGTWWFVANHGEMFSAAVPMASFVGEETLATVRGTPILALHSTVDEVVPIAPLRDAIKALVARGEDATLHEEADIPHYRSPAFAPVMRAVTVPWLRAVWAKGTTEAELPKS